MRNADEDLISADPLRLTLEAQRGGKAEFARQINVSPATLTNWFRRGIPAKRLRRVCNALGITADDYVSLIGSAVSVHRVQNLGVVRVPLRHVTHYDTTGTLASDHLEGEFIDHLNLNAEWLTRTFPRVNPKKLFAIRQAGNYMAPAFAHGDLLLVDEGVSAYQGNGVYFFKLSDEGGDDVFILRLQRRPDKSIAITGDNKSMQDPIYLNEDQTHELHILGQIIWTWSGKPPT